ncbi:MAG: c-type cytochrome [Solirubrobacteraceae bacterium]
MLHDSPRRRGRRRLAGFIAGIAVVLAAGGCGSSIKHPEANLVQGKVTFQKTCGGCHTLAHAATSGTTGPNLDDAFRQDRADGIKGTSIEGLVDYWIRYPNTEGVMPQMLLKGQDAQNVAAYVAAVAAKPGQDTGALASAGGVAGTTAAAGKTVFTGVGGCGSCHTLAAAGTTGNVGPNLDKDLRANCASPQSKQIRGATLQECIHTAIVKPYAYIPAGYKAGVMPSTFGQTLKPNEITALVNFISSAAK